jgi:hypothetical protein
MIQHLTVLNSELGGTAGFLGAVVARIKRRWESPQTCAQRLSRIVAIDRWSQPGNATWMFEEQVQPWPKPTNDEAMCARILKRTHELMG